jgi:N utilization substance protein B
MINREIIRLKVVQIAYAYYQNGGKNIETAEKELFFSLSKTYDLYNHLLLLMVEINRIAERAVETAQNRYQRIQEGELPSTKFVENRFMLQLQRNSQLMDFQENHSNWANEEEFVRSLYKQIIASDYYKEYMQSESSTYAEDRELWRKIYKDVICNNEMLDTLLEDMSLYWNDDKYIVDTFVLKTIKRFDEKNGESQELLPEFKDDEDREFAHRLFRNTLLNSDYYRKLISDNTKNWEFNRIAMMDLVIMQIALAEIHTFPNIPLSVTLNEYVDIAKIYSTPRSGSYVNGLLDAIAKKLIAENKVVKNL